MKTKIACFRRVILRRPRMDNEFLGPALVAVSQDTAHSQTKQQRSQSKLLWAFCAIE